MDPEQARSIRTKKRLQDQLNFTEQELTEDPDAYTEKALKNLERDAKDEKGQNELEKKEYFGYEMESFNMKNEREMGKIHEDGYFEFKRKRDPNEIQDAWLDTLEDNPDAIGKTKTKTNIKQIDAFDDKPIKLDEKELFHLKKELYTILNSGENAQQALNRFKPVNKAQNTKKKNVRTAKKVKSEENSDQPNAHEDNNDKSDSKKGGEVTKPETNDEEEKKRTFNRIIEICDTLVATGYMDAFSDTKEQIKEKFIKEEDKIIRSDLDELEKDLEDLNPDHNVVEE